MLTSFTELADDVTEPVKSLSAMILHPLGEDDAVVEQEMMYGNTRTITLCQRKYKPKSVSDVTVKKI